MKITHVNNAFIVVEGGGTKLICDPWTGTANYGTWHAIPIYDPAEVRRVTADADYVYISHLHQDHLDKKTLDLCGLSDARFVINRNAQPTLRRRIESFGAREVIECEPFTPVELGGLTVATVPQMSQYTGGLESDVDYDLDSSIIVTDGKAVFFNQVDNPLSAEDMQKINAWTLEHFGLIDVAALVCGAASEYPQCFMNIDRAAEQRRVEKASIDLLLARLRALKPRNMFLSGGAYFIPGRNAPLNRFVAVPPESDVREAVATAIPETGFLSIEGAMASLSGDTPSPRVEPALAPLHTDLESAIAATADLPYEQDGLNVAGLDAEIDRLLPLATAALASRLEHNGIRMKAKLRFALHPRLTIDAEGRMASAPERVLELGIEPEHPEHSLVLHLDKIMFLELIAGRMIWNLVISGSQIMYEREPDVFHPTDTGALNFFVHRERR